MKYINILIINIYYSLITIVTKHLSKYKLGEIEFYAGYIFIIFMLLIYAIGWQKILKKFTLSNAFSFKGSTIIFTLIFSKIFFNEIISLGNIVGGSFIVLGIILVNKYE